MMNDNVMFWTFKGQSRGFWEAKPIKQCCFFVLESELLRLFCHKRKPRRYSLKPTDRTAVSEFGEAQFSVLSAG